VASIIAGHGHGPGDSSGIIGVAPEARILSIRVTWENDDPVREARTDLNRNSDAVSRGIRYAVDRGAKIINMSLGGGRLDYYGNEIDKAAIEYALSKGVVLIASMGNDGATANRRNFPAAYPGVIAVGAVDRDHRPWKDSNRHEYVSVAAPGVEIVSADAGNAYVIGSGTSTSAAFVAGVAALIRADYPKLTPKEVKQAIEAGVSQRPAAGRDSKVGAGVVDAIGALKAAYKINKRRHNAAADAPKPAPASAGTPKAVAGPESAGTSILLIGVLVGGAVLVVAGLVMGWRQRHEIADDQIGGLAAASGAGAAARSVPAMASVPSGLEAATSGADDARAADPAQRPPVPSARRTGVRSFTADGEDPSGPHGPLSPYGRSARRAAPEPGPEPSATDARPVDASIAVASAVDPLGPEPLGPDPLGPDPLGPDPLGGGPLSADPLGTGSLGAGSLSTERFNADPLGADPFRTDPHRTDPHHADALATDPLGGDPLSTDEFASPTASRQRPRRPGAGQVAGGSEALRSSRVPKARTEPLPEDAPVIVRDPRPAQRPEATDPTVDGSSGSGSPQGGRTADPSGRQEAGERPARRHHDEDEEEDYRPPWW
jgi:hypothetical protein